MQTIRIPPFIAGLMLTVSTIVTPATSAAESGEHDHHHEHDSTQLSAHVHGIGSLNIAQEGDEIHVELDSPARNIVGFEYKPSSARDQDALAAAVTILRDGGRLFSFDPEAECRLESAELSSALLDSDSGSRQAADTNGHQHAGESAEGHADFRVDYHFVCSQPGRVSRVNVNILELFPETERLDVQYIVGDQQGAATLSAANPVVRF